jgi:hypothetical protein
MLARTGHRGVACAFAMVVLLGIRTVPADIVTLNSGAAIQGHVVAAAPNSPLIEVHTPIGTRIVLARADVKSVQRGSIAGPQSNVVKKTASKSRLTVEEQAWMPKVRMLVARLTSDNRESVRRAKSDLLKITDPCALPALGRYLGTSPVEAARLLFIEIVHGIPNTQIVYSLVALSVFDPSASVREEARKAIGSERADSARVLYINLLKIGEPRLSSRVSEGLAVIGDPNGDSVPYLIDNVVYRGTMEVVTRPGMLSYGIPPGLDICGTPVYRAAVSPIPGNPMTLYPVGTRATGPYSQNMPLYIPGKSETVEIDQPNSEVLESLVKVTNQKYPGHGYHPGSWRLWWESEKANRNLQKSATPGSSQRDSIIAR